LWAAASLVLGANGLILLLACDFNVPSILGQGRRFCPVPVETGALAHELARKNQLETRMHEAELRLARVPRCADGNDAAPPAPQGPATLPSPQGPTTPQRSEGPNGPRIGARGKLEITLWWHTVDDLDLRVVCPGGMISPSSSHTTGPGICGDGVHDVEANRNMIDPVNDPAEHIVWKRDIPEGSYKVLVVPKSTLRSTPIDYKVRVDLDGASRVCSGQVRWDAEAGNGNAQVPLEFNPTAALPACQSSNVSMHKCAPDEPNCRKS
jgi:hypothetical protein